MPLAACFCWQSNGPTLRKTYPSPFSPEPGGNYGHPARFPSYFPLSIYTEQLLFLAHGLSFSQKDIKMGLNSVSLKVLR